MLLKKIIRRKRSWAIFIPALLVYLASPFVHFYQSDAAWLKSLGVDQRDDAFAGHLQGPEAELRYIRIGDDATKPLLVFVHGAPGSGLFWDPLLMDEDLQQTANLLVYDRPGYGGSDYGEVMLSVEEQAIHLYELIKDQALPNQGIVVIGSSYGGTVAARLAMDYPGFIDGLMLQSASLKAGSEAIFGITYPTMHWSLRWLVPGAWDVANQEKLSHEAELLAMEEYWDNIITPSVIIQGSADWLIYPDNSYYACTEMICAPRIVHHMVKDGAHDLIWTMPELLRDYLLELLRTV